jgi:pimeloyl-ACP methyl ester carboxylesterase
MPRRHEHEKRGQNDNEAGGWAGVLGRLWRLRLVTVERRPRSAVKAKAMFAVQQPLHWSAVEDVMGVPAWKSLPSWLLIADGDQVVPPEAQRQFAARMGGTTVEIRPTTSRWFPPR